LISTVVLFQARNRETINSTLKTAESFKVIMIASVTRPCFTTQHQTCKTKTTAYKTKTKTDFLVYRSFLRPTVSDHITGIDSLHGCQTGSDHTSTSHASAGPVWLVWLGACTSPSI